MYAPHAFLVQWQNSGIVNRERQFDSDRRLKRDHLDELLQCAGTVCTIGCMGSNKSSNRKNLSPAIVLLGGFAIIFLFFCFHLVQKNAELRTEVINLRQRQGSLSQELDRSNNSKAELIGETRESYPFSAFTVSSPLFVGKEVVVKNFSYRGSTMKELSIALEESVTVNVWDYMNVPPEKMVRFDQYLNAIPLGSTILTPEGKAKYQYVTAKGTIFTRSCGELSAQKYLTSTHTVFVSIEKDCEAKGISPGQEELLLKESTRILEKIADTIVF